jgi:hypothetical protein
VSIVGIFVGFSLILLVLLDTFETVLLQMELDALVWHRIADSWG